MSNIKLSQKHNFIFRRLILFDDGDCEIPFSKVKMNFISQPKTKDKPIICADYSQYNFIL